MKTDTHEEISFTNCYAGVYLNKKEGAIALDFKSQELVLYLNTSLYQGFAWLINIAGDSKELMNFVNWHINPKTVSRNSVIEIHGPEHSVCLVCSPAMERVQLNFEIGMSIDLKFADFKGIVELIKEAQDDLEWRRNLLQWTLKKESTDHHTNKDKKAS